MKRDIQYLQGLYTALFDDLAAQFPHLQRDLARDLSRLLSLIEARGLPYLMEDLPAACKSLERGLQTGFLTPNGLPGFRAASKVGPIPHHFKGLFLEVFDKFGVLRVDCSTRAIRALRQIFLMVKKYKIACEDSKTWKHVDEYFTIDREVRSATLNWDEDDLIIDNTRRLHLCNADTISDAPLLRYGRIVHDEGFESHSTYTAGALDAIQKVADIVTSSFGEFDPSEWRTKHGPGAVADQRHTQFKYDFPTWPAKLDVHFPLSQFAFSNYNDWVEFVGAKGTQGLSSHESPSVLIAVPKTLSGPRLIAKEPTSHQWCQQAMLDFFAHKVAKSPIRNSVNFRSQERNRQLALIASLDGSYATIDLSSASDRISCWLVERIFRSNTSVLRSLHACRTRWISNEIDKKSPRYHILRKFSSQGSACTFPVESIIFSIIAVGSLLYKRGLPVTTENIRTISTGVRVFGDDIVIATDGAELCLETLVRLGNKPNPAKCFLSGNFRESCGMDAFAGDEVTPVRVSATPDKSRPGSIISSVDVHNNLLMRGYSAAAEFVKSTVMRERKYLFPYVAIGSGTFGWWSFSGLQLPSHAKTRFNEELQRMEALLDVAYAKSTRDPADGSGQVLQWFTEAAGRDGFIHGDRIGVPVRPANKIVRRWVPVTSN